MVVVIEAPLAAIRLTFEAAAASQPRHKGNLRDNAQQRREATRYLRCRTSKRIMTISLNEQPRRSPARTRRTILAPRQSTKNWQSAMRDMPIYQRQNTPAPRPIEGSPRRSPCQQALQTSQQRLMAIYGFCSIGWRWHKSSASSAVRTFPEVRTTLIVGKCVLIQRASPIPSIEPGI